MNDHVLINGVRYYSDQHAETEVVTITGVVQFQEEDGRVRCFLEFNKFISPSDYGRIRLKAGRKVTITLMPDDTPIVEKSTN